MYLRSDSLCQLHIPASNGCVIRLQPICVVSAQIQTCPLRCTVPWPGALLAHRLMKFTSSKADVFSDQWERLLQEEKRNFCLVLSALSLSSRRHTPVNQWHQFLPSSRGPLARSPASRCPFHILTRLTLIRSPSRSPAECFQTSEAGQSRYSKAPDLCFDHQLSELRGALVQTSISD